MPFTKCITKIHWTKINKVKDLDLVMPMYNLIEHSLNKFDTRSSLWFYSKVFMVYYKDKSTNFNTDIYNTDDFKFFKNKAKL